MLAFFIALAAVQAALVPAGAASSDVSAPPTSSSARSSTVFAAISDWGGSGIEPYTTPGQLENAKAMDKACTFVHGWLHPALRPPPFLCPPLLLAQWCVELGCRLISPAILGSGSLAPPRHGQLESSGGIPGSGGGFSRVSRAGDQALPRADGAQRWPELRARRLEFA